MTTGIIDIDLSSGPRIPIDALRPGHSLFALVRWHGTPIGQVRFTPDGPGVSPRDLWTVLPATARRRLVEAVLDDWLPRDAIPATQTPMPSSTVAVCTRDRPEDLRRCLDSICASAGRETQVLVVDNAPSDEAASRVAAGYPVSYIREEQPGLNWARARAVREARGDVILFTDDDVVVDPGWIDAMRGPFTDASVGAVTGLVMPLELDTPAQWLFEAYGGFSRGFRRLEFSASNTVPAAAGRVGAGASMAFRRTLAETMGFFEVELDCGTATRSGGDAYAFYRVLRSGHRIVYTPAAVAWHRHRRDMEQLRSTLFGYSVGVYAFLLRCLHEHGDLHALSVGWQWFRGHHLREISRALRRQPGRLPLDLLMAEVRGCLAAPYVYISSRRRERLVMQTRTSSRPPAIRPAE